MSSKTNCVNQENLCANINKVYDWVIEQSTGSTIIPVDELPIDLPEDATNVEAQCTITDSEGTPLPPNTEVAITEISPREDRQFDVNGTLVTLQRVTFSKVVYVVLEVTGVDPATGSLFLITTDPVPFTFLETENLCAPAGTTLVVRISNFSCLSVINTDVDEVITGFGLEVAICQSIQSVAPATVELGASFCSPRDLLTEQCPNPAMPPQCPVIFPTP
ncbi:MAG TPA: hypothetical protein VFD33_02305 [Bacillota bacterium]|nr:hypothetical protein [Bacillota bacterium]